MLIVDLWSWGGWPAHPLVGLSLCLRLLPVALSIVAQPVTAHTQTRDHAHARSVSLSRARRDSRAYQHVTRRSCSWCCWKSQSPSGPLSECVNINEAAPSAVENCGKLWPPRVRKRTERADSLSTRTREEEVPAVAAPHGGRERWPWPRSGCRDGISEGWRPAEPPAARILWISSRWEESVCSGEQAWNGALQLSTLVSRHYSFSDLFWTSVRIEASAVCLQLQRVNHVCCTITVMSARMWAARLEEYRAQVRGPLSYWHYKYVLKLAGGCFFLLPRCKPLICI